MLFRSTLLVLLASFFTSCSGKSEIAGTPVSVKTNAFNANVAEVNSSPDSSNNDGFVKDEQAAIEIAVKEWTRMGLKEMIDQEKPYRAELVGDVWEVSGTAPENWVGGLAYARISQKDGKVLRAWHDK
jgi:hypothetical protein